jgi:hypothetical protein
MSLRISIFRYPHKVDTKGYLADMAKQGLTNLLEVKFQISPPGLTN